MCEFDIWWTCSEVFRLDACLRVLKGFLIYKREDVREDGKFIMLVEMCIYKLGYIAF